MSHTFHCPLCGLYFHYHSELDLHVREDHAPPPHLNRPTPQPRKDEHDREQTAQGRRSRAIR